LFLYKVADKCYTSGFCSFSPDYLKCMVEDYKADAPNQNLCDSDQSYTESTINGKGYVHDLQTCIAEAVFYV